MNRIALIFITLLASACAVGPDYQRPSSELPESWGSTPVPAAETETSIDNWWIHFGDSELTALIEESLAHNHDLQAAIANVDAAAASLRLARADYLPTVNATVDGTRASASESGAIPLPSAPYTEYNAGIVLAYEFDIWGRIRRANEAALAGLQHDIAVRDGVRAAVAAAVTHAYFETRALDRRIELLDRLYATRLDNLKLQKMRLDAGLVSTYDYEQSRSETALIAAELPLLHGARSRTLTALATLRGATPRAMHTEWQASNKREVNALPAAPEVPMDIPSTLLERRPDVRAAEQRLIAANARIGEAKAAYFPRLSLTGFGGGISTAFSTLLDAPARSWETGIALTQPLTDFNRVGANVNAASARHAAATADYAKAVQLAFQETLDALSGVSSARAVMHAQNERVAALSNAYRIAEARYSAGRISYLELLDVERQLRDIEQQQVTAQLALLGATVDLYRALGGGWQQQADTMASTRTADK